MQVKVEAGAEDVLAQQAVLTSLVDGNLQTSHGDGVLGTDVHVTLGSADGITCEKLENGYIRATFDMAKLTKYSGSPAKVIEFLYVRGNWTDATGEITNICLYWDDTQPQPVKMLVMRTMNFLVSSKKWMKDIMIEEIPDKELLRDGNDLIYNLMLPLTVAVLGDEVVIPTLEGKVKIKIKPGTQPGEVLRLRGKGVPDLNGYGRGDLLVNIGVYIPEKLSSQEKDMFSQMQGSKNMEPTEESKRKFF